MEIEGVEGSWLRRRWPARCRKERGEWTVKIKKMEGPKREGQFVLWSVPGCSPLCMRINSIVVKIDDFMLNIMK